MNNILLIIICFVRNIFFLTGVLCVVGAVGCIVGGDVVTVENILMYGSYSFIFIALALFASQQAIKIKRVIQKKCGK